MYYDKNKDDISKRKRKRRAENALTIKEVEKRKATNSFYSRTGWRWLKEELQWVQDEALKKNLGAERRKSKSGMSGKRDSDGKVPQEESRKENCKKSQ